jgi:peptide chain release factor subunit 1
MEWCLLAVNEHGVEVLLVEGSARQPGRVCDTCGWVGLDEPECPVDGRATRATADVLDDMARAVIVAGGRLGDVRRGTDLDRHTVAALLRFPVPNPVPT